jgi:hypothetical protein
MWQVLAPVWSLVLADGWHWRGCIG